MIVVDPGPKTEHNTNGEFQVLVLGTGLNRVQPVSGGVIAGNIFDELRALGLVYSQEPSPSKLHHRFCEVWA